MKLLWDFAYISAWRENKTGEWDTAHLVLVEGNSGELFELGLGL